jgi:hypothetical protein
MQRSQLTVGGQYLISELRVGPFLISLQCPFASDNSQISSIKCDIRHRKSIALGENIATSLCHSEKNMARNYNWSYNEI